MRLITCNIEFEWVLAANGYTIVENKEASCQLVVPNKGPLRVTQPLQKYPGLFKSFAKLEPTASGVVRFANRFGLLQSDPNQNSSLTGLKGQGTSPRFLTAQARVWQKRAL